MDFVRLRRPISAQLVGGRGHYEAVVQAAMNAERSVWIATANLKELMVEETRARPGRRRQMRAGRPHATYVSVLAVFEELVGRGVEIRILHAAPPSRPFREELGRRQGLLAAMPGAAAARGAAPRRRSGGPGAGAFELRACPRVHFKAVVIDGAMLYLGSANWTGAGLGAKGEGRRNFELGFVSADDLLLDEVQGLFDAIWGGGPCPACRLRAVCPAPLDGDGGRANAASDGGAAIRGLRGAPSGRRR